MKSDEQESVIEDNKNFSGNISLKRAIVIVASKTSRHSCQMEFIESEATILFYQ